MAVCQFGDFPEKSCTQTLIVTTIRIFEIESFCGYQEEMMSDLRFTDIHSSNKERQLPNKLEECSFMIFLR